MGRGLHKSSKTSLVKVAKSPGPAAAKTLTVQRLNHDSSWLISLEGGNLRIVLDPWLTGAEIDGFSLFNRAEHALSTRQVADLGRVDAIVVSMAFSDHCHEETLALFPSNIPIYAVSDALTRIRGDQRLSSRNLNLIADGPTRIGDSRTSVSHIPTSGLLDFVHQGLVVSSPEASIVYAPHGLILSGPTAQCLSKVSKGSKRVSLCLITASTYDLPLIIGGTVNLGLDRALPLLRALRPKYLIDTHSEQKKATGFVPMVARTSYPNHEESPVAQPSNLSEQRAGHGQRSVGLPKAARSWATMLTLSCHPLDVAIEKFDKRTHRRIDRRERKGATLTVRVGNGEKHLTVKSVIHNDVWLNREVVVLEDDKFFSFTFKEHNQVLIVSKPAGANFDTLRCICAALRKSVDSKQDVNIAAYVPPHQAVHPPTPELPPAPPPKKQPIFSPTKPSAPPRSLFQSPPSSKPGSSGMTPMQKKTRPGSPPLKQKPSSSPRKASPTKSSPSRPPLKQEELTVKQRSALGACLAGHNVFLTGGAGKGKSSLVALIVERMRRQHGDDAVYVTATTGLAACAIGGSTLHNFAGIGGLFHDGDDMNKAVQEVLNKVVAVKRWRACKVLVLDEVSMLSGCLLELVDLIGQRCRGNSKAALGGVQLVICGDFFQLPPISSKGLLPISFAFQSPVWTKCKFTNIVLDRVFRQNDSTFIALLEAVRRGELSPEGLALLNQRVGRDVHDHASGVVATKILTHKSDVDRCNDLELSHLAGEAHEYVASDSGEQKHAKFLDDYCPAKKVLKLKLRAQVILLKTIDAEKGLVNGARGIVVGFGAAPSYRPLVRFAPAASSGLPVVERTVGTEAFTTQSGGAVLATRMQLPLAGGWALSVHRSQGMSVDRAELHLSGVFEVGQAYVALSRVRTIEGLRLASPLLPGHIKAHEAVKKFYASIEEREVAH